MKAVARFNPQLLLDAYNSCLKTGTFPKRWKIQHWVLLSKGKSDPSSPSAYRPLCMLDTAGKLLEMLLKIRLKVAIHEAGDLSDSQYGFRNGRSTVDAVQEVVATAYAVRRENYYSRNMVLLVMLDVRNAFNSAKWEAILYTLRCKFSMPQYLLRMVKSYLKDRLLLYETDEGPKRRAVTAGVAQGSVLGPDLWNIFYDDILRIEMPEGCKLIGYADDLAVTILVRDLQKAQMRLNQVMRRVDHWLTQHELSLAPQKTEIVVLTRKRINTIVPIQVGGTEIETKKAVKYLGLMIDSKLTFWEQIRQAADKACTVTVALSRLMANVRGPKPSKRRLLMSITQAILLYGAEIWAEALKYEKYRRRMAGVQRRGALRVACSYRTVSEASVLVVAGIVPIDLLAAERVYVYQRKLEIGKAEAAKEARKNSIDKWQRRWDNHPSGRWTARLIGRLSVWIDRAHGETSYYLTQFLTGHGYFRE